MEIVVVRRPSSVKSMFLTIHCIVTSCLPSAASLLMAPARAPSRRESCEHGVRRGAAASRHHRPSPGLRRWRCCLLGAERRPPPPRRQASDAGASPVGVSASLEDAGAPCPRCARVECARLPPRLHTLRERLEEVGLARDDRRRAALPPGRAPRAQLIRPRRAPDATSRMQMLAAVIILLLAGEVIRPVPSDVAVLANAAADRHAAALAAHRPWFCPRVGSAGGDAGNCGGPADAVGLLRRRRSAAAQPAFGAAVLRFSSAEVTERNDCSGQQLPPVTFHALLQAERLAPEKRAPRKRTGADLLGTVVRRVHAARARRLPRKSREPAATPPPRCMLGTSNTRNVWGRTHPPLRPFAPVVIPFPPSHLRASTAFTTVAMLRDRPYRIARSDAAAAAAAAAACAAMSSCLTASASASARAACPRASATSPAISDRAAATAESAAAHSAAAHSLFAAAASAHLKVRGGQANIVSDGR